MRETKSNCLILREYLFHIENIVLSKKQCRLFVQEFNDFKMPISKRLSEILENPKDFIEFIKTKNLPF